MSEKMDKICVIPDKKGEYSIVVSKILNLL